MQQEIKTLWSPSRFRLPSFSIFSFQRQPLRVFVCYPRQVLTVRDPVKRGIKTFIANTWDQGSFRNVATDACRVHPYLTVGQWC